MKKALIFLILFLIGCTTAPLEIESSQNQPSSTSTKVFINSEIPFEEKQIQPTLSTFSFSGSLGKQYIEGTFDTFEGVIYYDQSKPKGMRGTLFTDSITSSNPSMESYLKAEILDTATHPTIEFISMNIQDNTMTGDLRFYGITKEISFPITITQQGIYADFILDLTPYQLKTTNKNIRIQFEFVTN